MTTKNLGETWSDYRKKLLTSPERASLSLRVEIASEIMDLREKNKMTQKDLEEFTGVKQQVISRLTNGWTNPNLSTLMKILAPMGKTLGIVPLKEEDA